MAYFDYNATAPLLPEAKAAWLEAQETHWHNPDSPHGPAARAHARLEAARERLAEILGCTAKEVVFTSGATEANNAVIADVAARADPRQRVVVSAIEHPCVLEPARAFFGAERCTQLPVTPEGVVDLEALEAVLNQNDAALVCLMAANNETGVMQPWREALELCQGHYVPLLVDAAQWLGECAAQGLGTVDFVTASAHKFGGPLGVGFLKLPTERPDFHGLRGGEQEHARRAGTSNYPAIAGMLAALETMERRIPLETAAWLERRANFEATVGADFRNVRILGAGAERLPGTVSLAVPHTDNFRWVRLLDKRGFAVSTGSACATAKEGPSHVLAAMGLSAEEALRVVRISGGPDTGADDWQALAQAIIEVDRQLRDGSTRGAEASTGGSRVISI
ncbi:MAG: cysteine desulfurase family protein [Opitutales bacterium]